MEGDNRNFPFITPVMELRLAGQGIGEDEIIRGDQPQSGQERVFGYVTDC